MQKAPISLVDNIQNFYITEMKNSRRHNLSADNWISRIDAIVDYLVDKDISLKPLVERFGTPSIRGEKDYFTSLVRAIVHQQLSGKAAGTIYRRLKSLFPNGEMSPSTMLKIKHEQLRTVGLSMSKTLYIKELAKTFVSNLIPTNNFSNMTDSEISDELTKIKGIGQWTTDMFLIFTLKRPDVFPINDVGIQKGFEILYDLTSTPTKDQMTSQSTKWKPYRTVVSLYLWQIVDDGFGGNEWNT
jgi:DNA-3-methyladenine glycosylase II